MTSVSAVSAAGVHAGDFRARRRGPAWPAPALRR